MALPLASWSFLFFQFALLYSARGREIPISNLKDVDDKDAYDITKHAVDDHFWIYTKQSKEMRDDGGAPMIDAGRRVDSDGMHQEQDAGRHLPMYAKKSEDVKQPGDDEFRIYAKEEVNQKDGKGMKKDGHDHAHHRDFDMDPSLHVFFTVEDLKIGNTIPLYFPAKPDPSKTPRLLPREEAESIPFSSSQLSSLLDYFSFPKRSPQAKAMAYTLEQCELEPIEGEVKFCATSLEAMLDRAHQIFGPGTASRALTTTYLSMGNTANPLRNYTILETPKQVAAPRMIGCHPMPYPYAVFYCHSQLWSENRLYQVSLGGQNGERVEAAAVCHMDTTKWDADHVSFRVLGIEPGSSPVCHFFPVDNLIWVPVQSDHV